MSDQLKVRGEVVEKLKRWMRESNAKLPLVAWGTFHDRIACGFAQYLAEEAAERARKEAEERLYGGAEHPIPPMQEKLAEIAYDCDDDSERIDSDDPEGALEAWVDDAFSHCEKGERVQLPRKKRVCAFKRMEISDIEVRREAERAAEEIVERWDEDYGDPDNWTEISDEMRAVAQEFAEKMRKLYTVWAMEYAPEHDVVLSVEEWVAEMEAEDRAIVDWVEEE